MLITTVDVSAQYGNYGYSRRDDRRHGNYRNALQTARRYGYADGLNDGADAAREGDSYHPQNSGDWQKGTNGYESNYGSRSAYKQAYRDAYLAGYRAGYQRSNRGRDRDWRRNY
jgi:hypothetical protein